MAHVCGSVRHRHAWASVCLYRFHSSVPGRGTRKQRAENGDPQHQERVGQLRGSRNDGEHAMCVCSMVSMPFNMGWQKVGGRPLGARPLGKRASETAPSCQAPERERQRETAGSRQHLRDPAALGRLHCSRQGETALGRLHCSRPHLRDHS